MKVDDAGSMPLDTDVRLGYLLTQLTQALRPGDGVFLRCKAEGWRVKLARGRGTGPMIVGLGEDLVAALEDAVRQRGAVRKA